MRIGELAERAGTTAKTLRFYEEQGLLPPAERTPSGYRATVSSSIAPDQPTPRARSSGISVRAAS